MPVADERTKALAGSFAKYIKSMHKKYPKLRQEMDVEVETFLSSQLIESILTEDLDRVIQITQYVPQTVKVENVYTYDSEKQRKVEFHLRILLKALLEALG